jgi:hypothetical protein
VSGAFIGEGTAACGSKERNKSGDDHMAYAISSEEHGTFIGFAMGMAFFSRNDTVGQYHAYTESSRESMEHLASEMQKASDTLADLKIVEVASGHWRDLQAAGLHIGDMAANQLMAEEPVGAC